MNILFVTHSYYPATGGVSRSIESFRSVLLKQGHIVYIIAPQMDGAKYDPYVLRLKSLTFFQKSNDPPPFLISENKYLRFLDIMQKSFIPELNIITDNIPFTNFDSIMDLIHNMNIDIVHSHIPFNMGEFAYKVSRQIMKPLVYTVHTRYNMLKHRYKMENVNVDIDLAAVFFANRCNGVIFPTVSILSDFISKGYCGKSYITLPTGIDTSLLVYAKKKTLFKNKGFVIGTLSRLDKEKNLEFLFEIVFHLMALHQDIQFLAVGDGPLKEYGINFFESKNLSDRVIFYGSVVPEKVSSLYNEMDCFLFTSLFETQGLVISEAQACGLPVVALDCPAVSNVLGNTGFLCSTKDELIKILEKLYVMPSIELSSIARDALENASNYSIENITLQLIDFYNSLRNP